MRLHISVRARFLYSEDFVKGFARKPPAVLAVPKSFSFAQFQPQRKAPLCKGSCQQS